MRLLDLPVALGLLPRRLAPGARRFLLPFLSGLTIAAAGVSLGQALTDQESVQISRLTESEAARVKGEVAARMASRVRALRDLATRWERSPRPVEAEWR